MKRVIYLLAILLLSACSKDKPVKDTGSLESFATLSQRVINIGEPYNHSNPYDSIGIIHNQALFHVQQYIQQTRDTSLIGKRKAVAAFFKEKYGRDLTNKLEHTYRSIKTRYPNGLPERLPKGLFRKTAATYIQSVFEIVRRVDNRTSYSDLKKTLLSVESKISTDRSLSRKDMEGLLHFLSIARHSTWFWFQVDLIDNGTGYETARLLKNIFKFFGCAHADMYGFLESFLSGEPYDMVCADTAGQSAMMAWYIDAWL